MWSSILAFFKGGGPSSKPQANSKAVKSPKAPAPGASSPAKSDKQTRRSAVAADPGEINTPRLYVGNLSYDATESDLFELFNGVGKVQNAEIVTHRQTQRSKGFGFVVMQSVEEAKRAVDVLHDKEFLGRKLIVGGAKDKNQS